MKSHKNKRHTYNRWIIISLAFVVLIGTGIIARAKYLDANNQMKRVIVAKVETQDIRFTSNLMHRVVTPSPWTDTVSENSKVTINGLKYYPVEVIVRNYTTSDTEHFYERDLAYEFTAELTDAGGNYVTDAGLAACVLYGEQSSAASFGLSGGVYAIPKDTTTLTQAGLHEKSYKFWFREDLLDSSNKVFIKITANPTVERVRNEVGILKGLVGIARQTSETIQTWTGNFTDNGAAADDQGQHSVEAGAYDGFNYMIQGSGSMKVSLKWDSSVIELNPFSKTEIETVSQTLDPSFVSFESIDSNGWTTLTFMVDSDAQSRYDMQFYMKGAALNSWDELSGLVIFTPNVGQ